MRRLATLRSQPAVRLAATERLPALLRPAIPRRPAVRWHPALGLTGAWCLATVRRPPALRLATPLLTRRHAARVLRGHPSLLFERWLPATRRRRALGNRPARARS